MYGLHSVQCKDEKAIYARWLHCGWVCLHSFKCLERRGLRETVRIEYAFQVCPWRKRLWANDVNFLVGTQSLHFCHFWTKGSYIVFTNAGNVLVSETLSLLLTWSIPSLVKGSHGSRCGMSTWTMPNKLVYFWFQYQDCSFLPRFKCCLFSGEVFALHSWRYFWHLFGSLEDSDFVPRARRRTGKLSLIPGPAWDLALSWSLPRSGLAFSAAESSDNAYSAYLTGRWSGERAVSVKCNAYVRQSHVPVAQPHCRRDGVNAWALLYKGLQPLLCCHGV